MEEEWLLCHCYDIRMSHTAFRHRSQYHAAGLDNAASLSSVCRQIPSSHGTDAVPNLTDNGVLMVHRAWADRFRCTKANQPNLRYERNR